MSIRLIDVGKSYDSQTEVLQHVTTKIETGEFFAIVGPSGCGKSTLLRMIAGLTPITEGQIQIDHQIINELPPKDRKLTMVFQSYALYPFLNVWENVAFGLKARKVDKAEVVKRVDHALKMVNMSDLAQRKPRELSGGQRQRVALARAVASDAKICLMDEPLSNLDAQLRIKMRQDIHDLQRQLGLTLIYVTHDQVEAMTMADHIMVLHDHQIQQVGTPTEIYQNPANAFVAQFFGTPQINLLEAQQSSTNPHTAVIEDGFNINVPEQLPTGAFKLGIRPRDLTLETSQELDRNAVVENTEFLGDETIVYAKLNDGDEVRLILPGQVNLPLSTNIQVHAKGSVLLFDETGARIRENEGRLVHA